MLKNFTAFVLCFMVTFSFGQQAFIKDSLDQYINQGLKDWKIPGLAIVIVKDGKVVLRKGYGVKDITTKSEVDVHTHFFIASNSKLFTGTALAKLDYEKKLNLNDKISKYYPDFALYDKTMTENVTIKDILTHRIGTKTFQGDFTFWNTNLSSTEIMQKMRYLAPINAFRDAYGYCNSCYLTAGMVIPKVTNQSWENYITEEFLKPLRMSESFASSNGIEKKSKNIATPYTSAYTDQLIKLPFDRWDNLAPAASIVSNVFDLTSWLQFQLDSGKFEAKQIVPWPVIQRTRDAQIITSSRKSSLFPSHFRAYGLGVFSTDYNGRQVYWHTGGAGGMLSNVCFVPEEKLGIAILTNNDNQNFFELLRYQILDAYLGVEYVNRSQQQLANHQKEMDKQVSEINNWKAQAKNQAIMSRNELEQYTGAYTNELYGNIELKIKDNHLFIVFKTHPDLTATLKNLGNDEWLIEYNNVLYGVYTGKFTMVERKVKSLSIRVNEFVEIDAYEFMKIE